MAGILVALLVVGALRKWWTRSIRPHDAAPALARTAMVIRLASWHQVGLPR